MKHFSQQIRCDELVKWFLLVNDLKWIRKSLLQAHFVRAFFPFFKWWVVLPISEQFLHLYLKNLIRAQNCALIHTSTTSCFILQFLNTQKRCNIKKVTSTMLLLRQHRHTHTHVHTYVMFESAWVICGSLCLMATISPSKNSTKKTEASVHGSEMCKIVINTKITVEFVPSNTEPSQHSRNDVHIYRVSDAQYLV